MPDKSEPITDWLKRLPDGDSLAQQKIWQEFAEDIRNQARKYLLDVSTARVDDEDVMAKVFKSLFMRLTDHRLVVPENRRQLWGLLRSMTRKKSAEVARYEAVGRRPPAGSSEMLDKVPSDSPDPRAALEQLQTLKDVLASLPSDTHRQIILLRTARHSDDEIAEILQLGKRTVQRRRKEIRNLFADSPIFEPYR